MPDAEIQILIRAVDEATATLKKIEGQLVTSGDNIKKTTENTSKAFEEQTGSILVLGNAAARVDSIFDSYENMQLRLENSSERVANAQDRLTDAQYDLNKLMKAGKKGTDEYRKAELELERATRGLNISQNNLAKTQNQVVGTYIQIGMSVVTLLASIPTLITAVKGLGLSFVSLQAAMGPIGWILLGITAAVGAFMLLQNQQKKLNEEITAKTEAYSTALQDLATASQRAADKQGILADAIKEAQQEYLNTIMPKTAEEARMEADIAKLRMQGRQEEADALEEYMNQKYTLTREWAVAELNAQSVEQQQAQGLLQDTTNFYKGTLKEKEDWLKTYGPRLLEIQARLEKEAFDKQQEAAGKLFEAWKQVYNMKMKAMGGRGTTETFKKQNMDFTAQINWDQVWADMGTVPSNQTNVNINGPIYGVSAGNISQALQKELNQRIK